MSRLTFAFWTCALFVSTTVLEVNGHGRLEDPPNRSSLWRFTNNPLVAPHASQLLRDFSDDSLDCGGTGTLRRNNGNCGICGDPYDAAVKENEAGGRYALGIISRRYEQGQIITVQVRMTIGHTGFFEFRLCPWNNPNVPATQECLDRYLLQQENGATTWNSARRGVHTIRLRLPENVTCTQCVFQWKHTTGDFGRGSGIQERHWMGCADVAITPLPTTTTTTTTEAPTTTTTTTIETTTTTKLPSVETEVSEIKQIDCSYGQDMNFKCMDCTAHYVCLFTNFPIMSYCPEGKMCDSRNGGCVSAENVPSCTSGYY